MLDRIKKKFTESFNIKDFGKLNHYLGMKIIRTYESIKIDQLTTRFEHLLSSNLDKTYTMPMDRDIKITKADLEDMTEEQG